MCSIDGAEPWQFYDEERRRAGNLHFCYECGRTIEKGEGYLHAVGRYEGRWERMRMCSHCEVGADWLRAVCGGFSWGGVLDEVAGRWDEVDRSQGLGRYIILSGRARHARSVVRVDRWHRDGVLVPVPPPIPVPVWARRTVDVETGAFL